MYVRHLSLIDFRSYPSAEVPLGPGVTTLVGQNGQGKTNIAEAIGYLATLGSHRVSSDAPLVRFGASQAIVRGDTTGGMTYTNGLQNSTLAGNANSTTPRAHSTLTCCSTTS